MMDTREHPVAAALIGYGVAGCLAGIFYVFLGPLVAGIFVAVFVAYVLTH